MYFNVGDASYYYHIEGAGPPVVLLHGFTGSSDTWNHFVSNYKEQFQLITIDLPGHGKTKTSTPRTMERCCQDLAQILDHLQLSGVHLAGYSMGGRTALSFAMLFPKKITSLTLESASPGLTLEEERKQRALNDKKLAEKIENEGIMSFVNFWENIPLFQTQKHLPIYVQQTIRKERLSQTEKGLSQSLRFMGTGVQPSWWNKLDTLKCPVHLIVGEKDTKFVTINEKMKRLFPSARLNVVEGAGHAIHVEKPDQFNKLVSSFIMEMSEA